MAERSLEYVITARADDLTRALNTARTGIDSLAGASARTSAQLKAQLESLNRIEVFRGQKAQLAEAEKAYAAAQTKVAALAREMRSTDAPSKAQVAAFNQARASAATLATSLDVQRASLERLRRDLSASGVDTRSLSAAQQGLRASLDATAAAAAREAAAKRSSVSAQQANVGAAQTLGIRLPQTILADIQGARAAYGQLAASGQLSAQQLQVAHNAMTARVQALRGELSGVQTPAQGVVSAMTAIKVAVSAIVIGKTLEGLKNTLVDIVQTGARFEVLKTQINGLMGGMETGQVAFDWIQNFAIRTPLELEQVTTSFVKLKGFGIDPMGGALQAMVDTNAAAGGSAERLDRIVLALGQAYAKGKLQMEEMLQLVEAGVPTFALLQQATGLTQAELSELSKEGKLGRDVIASLIATMGQVNAGAADAQMRTFTGTMSNLSDTWSKFVASVAEAGVLDKLTAEISTLLSQFDDMAASGALDQLATDIADNIVGAIDTIKAFAVTIFELRQEIATAGVAFAAFRLGSFISGLTAATAAAGGLATGVRAVGAAVTANPIGLLMAGAATAATFAWQQMTAAVREADAALDAQIAKQKAFRSFTSDLVTAQDAMKKAGVSESNQAVLGSLAKAAREGRIEQEQAAKVAREYTQQVLSSQTQLSQEKTRLTQLESSLSRARAAEEKALAVEGLKARQKAAEDEVTHLKGKLQEGLAERRRIDGEIKRLRGEIREDEITTQDALAAIRRRDMNEVQQQTSLQIDIVNRLKLAKQLMAQGDLEGARKRAQEAVSMGQQLKDEQNATAAVVAGSTLIRQTKEQELAAQEAAAKKQGEANRTLSESIETAKAQVVSLKAEIDKLGEAPETAKIEADITQAQSAIAQIEAKLQSLAAGVVVPVTLQTQNSTGVQVPLAGFATGGPIGALGGRFMPGYGGGDRRLVLVEDGEFVINKAATARYFGLLSAINYGGDLPGFKAGGAISAPMTSAQPARDVVRIELDVGGREVRGLFGSRDSARELQAAMREMNRGRVR